MSEEGKKEENKESTTKIQVDKSEYESLMKKVDHLTGEVNKLANHNEQLFNETKKAKEKAKEKEEALKSTSDFEQLFKTTDEKRKELEEKLNHVHNERAKEKIKSEAIKLASSQGLAEGANVELLSTFIEKRLKYTDEGIKVLDENGNLTVSKLDDLKQEFIKNPKYASLITSTKATGGGATGSRSGASKITLTRNEFNQLSPIEKSNFFLKDGGKLED